MRIEELIKEMTAQDAERLKSIGMTEEQMSASAARKKEVDEIADRLYTSMKEQHSAPGQEHEMSYMLSRMLGTAHADAAKSGGDISRYLKLSSDVHSTTFLMRRIEHALAENRTTK